MRSLARKRDRTRTPNSSRQREPVSSGIDTIYLLEHARADEDDEDVKTIGVYREEATARGAIDRLGKQPGFRDYPDGWIISSMRLDHDHWAEGFVYIPYEEL